MRLNCLGCGKLVNSRAKGAKWHQLCFWEYKRGIGRTRKNIFDKSGYVLIYKPNHPAHDSRGYIRQHRLIMEMSLGRYLKPNEYIHHMNHNPADNRIENLMLVNGTEHAIIHGTGRIVKKETRIKMSKARKNQIPPTLGFKHSEETKRKMSKARKLYWKNKV